MISTRKIDLTHSLTVKIWSIHTIGHRLFFSLFFPFSLGSLSHEHIGNSKQCGTKPRLVRQQAVQEESAELSCSPPRLGVRFLPTIPSAADSSVVIDEESNNDCAAVGGSGSGPGTPFYTVLQSGNTLTTLSSPKNKTKPP